MTKEQLTDIFDQKLHAIDHKEMFQYGQIGYKGTLIPSLSKVYGLFRVHSSPSWSFQSQDQKYAFQNIGFL